MGDQVEKSGTSTLCSCCDGAPYEGFVIELGLITAVELKDAVFAHHVGGALIRGLLAIAAFPSWVGMQARQGLHHQGNEKLARYLNRRQQMRSKILLQ
ncbi:MAG: Uncharacterised protein [Prochlorococcus marinus str. MIT 9215]|nr:MAG: Uncharacterised protein [Prochlorococcus marinus str. MIT 9215]